MWWDSLSAYSQISFVIAVTSTAILVIFLVLMIIGVEGTDYEGSPDYTGTSVYNDTPVAGIFGLKIINFRSILIFLSVSAWLAFLFYPLTGWVWATVIATTVGAAIAIFVAYLYYQAMKLESSGNINYLLAVGKTAVVRVRVPKSRGGKGKIAITLQERLVEIDAVTDEEEDLVSNAYVEVVDLLDENTLIVQKI